MGRRVLSSEYRLDGQRGAWSEHHVIMAKEKPFEITTFSKKPKKFFREDDNYRKILKNITKDKIVKKASKYYPGLRVKIGRASCRERV